jgi:hypothetical protein
MAKDTTLNVIKSEVKTMQCCKKCGSLTLYQEQKGQHLGLYCKDCGAWIKWVSQGNTCKTKEEYRNEYLEKQDATDAQYKYICKLIDRGMSKRKASQVIEILKEGQEDEE